MQSESAIIGSYRVLFMVGCILAFSSYFIDWYHVQYLNELGQVVLSCSYHVLLGWNVVDHIYYGALEQFYPVSAPLAIEFVVFYFGLLVISTYIAAFKSPNLLKGKKTSANTGYILLTTAFMTIIMMFYFTFTLMVEDGMHVPLLIIDDQVSEVVVQQSIDIGFFLQAIAFIFLFPLAWVQIRMHSRFELASNDQADQGNANFGLNLDQYIAEELVHCNTQKSNTSRRTGK